MKIILVPQRRDDTLQLIKQGSTLTINGEAFNLSNLEEGDTLPLEAIACEWFAGPVEMIDGVIVVTLILPNPWNYSQAQAFPVPISVTKNGLVELPAPLPVVTEEATYEQY